MATVKKTVPVCDRDAFGKEKPATETRRFSIDDNHYKLVLCEQHAVMFDREMLGWSRLAEFDESRAGVRMIRSDLYHSPEHKERERRAAALRAEQSRVDAEVYELTRTSKPSDVPPVRTEADLSHLAMSWVLTPHAEKRAELRGFTLTEVLETAERPEQTYSGDPKYGTQNRIHQRGECAVVVNTKDKVVISVLHRTTQHYHPDTHRSQIASAR